MQPFDSCRLIVNRLDSYVENPFSKKAYFDFKKFYMYNYEAMRLADDLIDLEIEYVDRILQKVKNQNSDTTRTEIELWEKIKETGMSARRAGLGITALGDCLAALGLKYDSDEALEMIDKIFHTKMESELDCTIDLSILRGTFKGWDKNLEFSFYKDQSFAGNNDFYNFLNDRFPKQVDRMCAFGRRNVSWSTCAPTGSVSLLANNCTGGIEPLFSPYYFRRKKINPNDKDSRVDFIDQNEDKWQEFAVIHPKFKDWLQMKTDMVFSSDKIEDLTKEELQKYFEVSPWFGSTANDINWVKRVEIQSIIQKYISHSISSTINLPSNVTNEDVEKIYFESWKKGLKGITVYVDGSRSGVLITEPIKESFEYKDAIKRPKSLKCDIHTMSSKGNKYNIIIGLLDEKPYEVFSVPYFTDKTKMELVKIKQGRYDLVENGKVYSEDISSEMNSEEEILTRLISTGLRHGTDIQFLVEQLLKTNGDLTSFSKCIARTLKTYIKDGTKSTLTCTDCGSKNIIFKEGCNSCLDCGSSKCG